MATNTVNGILNCSDGSTIPLQAEIAEATESTLTTSTAFTGVAQDIGDYAPGKVVVSGLVSADNGFSYAYILRQGVVEVNVMGSIKGTAATVVPLNKPVKLQAGDKLRVLTTTGSTRQAALSVFTNKGTSRIFVVTPSGAATNSLLDLQTSNSIGNTLQSEIIVAAAFTSIDSTKIESPGGGAAVLNNLGNCAGAVPACSPGVYQPAWQACRIPVALNYTASFVTNA
jgi:hypothetical protein